MFNLSYLGTFVKTKIKITIVVILNLKTQTTIR